MALPPHARRKLDSEVSRTPSESTQRDDSSSSSTRLQCATAASAASTASSANAASAAELFGGVEEFEKTLRRLSDGGDEVTAA